MRILVVEDDAEMAAMLYRVLMSSGFTVDLAQDGRTALRESLARDYTLIVLDLMLPYVDGLRICKELRDRRKTTPILMITARDTVNDRVRGLELGADDYLPKPFDVRELLARVRALIRRDRVVKGRYLAIGELKIDTRHRAVSVGGRPLALTRTEYGILELLAGQVGRVVLRETLLDLVWEDCDPGSNKLDVAVRALRRKLEAERLDNMIRTVYGSGYMLQE